MDFQNLVSVEWSNKLVLLTVQLAKYYTCTPKQIAQNFNKNRDRFIEGKHYFKLEGEVLKAFRVYFDDIELDDSAGEVDIPAHTKHLYLWTARGAARHAKMLSTDKAWEVFEDLEDNYFNRNTSPVAKPAPAVNPNRRAAQLAAARVYVLLMSDGSVQIVKLGQSKNACQEKFSSRRVEGEFFSVEFEEACKAIDSFVKMVSVSAIDSDFEHGRKIFKVMKRNIVKLLADKNPS
ncbi:MAG: ORF6N domain-containing protein [Selenomonadaceae bacterium]|nr:ORF6N domain-containing protein [Selenomonadaceae bacterium]